MTRPLPAAQPRPARTPFRWPTLRRAHIATINPVRTDTITVDTWQAHNLADNPDVEIRHARFVAPGQVRMVVRYPDRAAPPPARQAPIRLEWNRPALRAIREVAIAVGKALTWALAVGAATVVTGGLLWHLLADELTAAARILLIAGGSTVALIALVWLLSAKAGICPGLHCPGCPHH